MYGPGNEYHGVRVCSRRAKRRRFAAADVLLLLFVLTLLLSLYVFSPCPGTGAFISGGLLKEVLSAALPLDGIYVVRYSLPGTGAGPDCADPSAGLPNYPLAVVGSELTVFRMLHNTDDNIDTAALQAQSSTGKEEVEGDETAPQDEMQPEEEKVTFLGGIKPESPSERPLFLEKEDPLVLIYHTHTTESFLPVSGKAFTDNLDQTVVVLGEYLERILEDEYGIPVLHCRDVFDVPRRQAYQNAYPAIKELLDRNRQVQVVLDLHRDGVPREVTTTEMDGFAAGRVLFVVGSRHENWYRNMRFALFLDNVLNEKYPGFSRGVRKQSFNYNQHLHSRSLIVEVGGHENSMEEVKRAIPYLAEAIAAAFE